MRKWLARLPRRSVRYWTARDLGKGLLYQFRRVVSRSGDRVAIRCDGRKLTYQKLDELSDRLAKGLLNELGRLDEDASRAPIGIFGTHSEWAVVAILGVLKTGVPHIFFPHGESEGRRRAILSTSKIRLLLLENSTLEPLVASSSEDLRLVDMEALLRTRDNDLVSLPNADPSADYAISFSSGTTGEPKGVIRTQRALLHQASFLAKCCGLDEKDRIAMIIPASFGSSSNDIWAALLTGASLHPFSLADGGTIQLAECLAREEITYCHCVPSVFRSLLGQLTSGKELSALRWFKLGGEPLFAGDVEKLRRLGISARILHSYGAAETGGTICAETIHSSDVLPAGALPVGRPIPGKKVTILGEEGSLIVTSRYLAAGYYGDSGNPSFETTPQGKIRFRSKDLGRFAPDGRLHLFGRHDGMVKLLGRRVDVGDLEDFLRGQESVADCAIVANEEAGRLEVFVMPRQRADPEELRRILQQRIEMRPKSSTTANSIHTVVELPVKPNGKIDREQLRRLARESDPSLEARNSTAPRSKLEEQICRIWEQVLGRSDFGIYDSFFSLGGDSLAAVNFQTHLEKLLGFSVSAAALLADHRTIAEISESLRHASADTSEAVAPLVSIRPGGEAASVVFLPGGYGGEGDMILFARMVPWLEKSHSVFGFRATDLYQVENPPRSVPEIADLYHQLLSEALGDRPPVLIGNCIAGPVALELARRFRDGAAAGSEPVLILLDAASRRGWFRRNSDEKRQKDHPPFARFLYDLLDGFEPAAYEGSARLILTESYRDEETPLLGWDDFVKGEIRVDRIDGDHLGALREEGDRMGRHLARAIAEELALR